MQSFSSFALVPQPTQCTTHLGHDFDRRHLLCLGCFFNFNGKSLFFSFQCHLFPIQPAIQESCKRNRFAMSKKTHSHEYIVYCLYYANKKTTHSRTARLIMRLFSLKTSLRGFSFPNMVPMILCSGSEKKRQDEGTHRALELLLLSRFVVLCHGRRRNATRRAMPSLVREWPRAVKIGVATKLAETQS